VCEKKLGKEREQQGEKENEPESDRTCEKSREPPWSSDSSMVEDTIKALIEEGAICQEVRVRQAQISTMIRCAWWGNHFAQIEDYLAQIYSRISSINERTISMLREAHHTDISIQQANHVCWLLSIQNENNATGDFLGRTIGHQLLDQLSDNQARSILLEDFQFFEVESLHQVQDRLDRTLLHLLCQKGSYEFVERSLQIGADPSATTIYGHLPLHYAAQRGDFDICELLLRYKEMFDIGQIDKYGNTACDYASWENHQRVKSLLLDAAREQRISRMFHGE
jgi:hypothetical protein